MHSEVYAERNSLNAESTETTFLCDALVYLNSIGILYNENIHPIWLNQSISISRPLSIAIPLPVFVVVAPFMIFP